MVTNPALRLACYGFADSQEGSLLGANFLVLKELLRRGIEIEFFNKQSFMPLRELRNAPGFRFVDCHNPPFDDLNRWLRPRINAVARHPLQFLDHQSFARKVVRRMRSEHRSRDYHGILYLGTAAFGRVADVPTVAWLQGPPGTDARSIRDNWTTLCRVGGLPKSLMYRWYASYRQSVGAPNYRFCDRLIVGSRWSVIALRQHARFDGPVDVLPYPTDTSILHPTCDQRASEDQLALLWLGRIVPRKRLDVFLEGSALAIRSGVPLAISVVGQFRFFRDLKSLLDAFPFPEKLTWVPHVPKADVAKLFSTHDVLAQPSDEENFGSSVAEAQMAGLPVICGPTNGTADYICPRSIHLQENTPAAFCNALREIWKRKNQPDWLDRSPTIEHARKTFCVETIVDHLLEIIAKTGREHRPNNYDENANLRS